MKIKNIAIPSVVAITLGLSACHHHADVDKTAMRNNNKSMENVAVNSQMQMQASAVSSTYEFAFDSDKVDENSRNTLAQYAEVLRNNPNAMVRVEGHTDAKGNARYNVGLGKRRAEAVARVLAENGVEKDRIMVQSFGADHPAVMGDSSDAYAKNRRAELFFEVESAVS